MTDRRVPPSHGADDRQDLRRTFGTDAERYDRARPGYPAELFKELSSLACVGAGCRVLEIGIGTGQATLPLAECGCDIVAIELNPALAEVARQKLARFADVEVVTGAFEDWPLPDEPFDTVISATAFHWLDPDLRVLKAADALRVGGSLATISTHHVAGGTEDFFVEVQSSYDRWDPATPPGLRLPAAADIAQDTAELDRSGRFGPAAFRRYEWEAAYTSVAYLDLLRTYSGHIALPPDARAGLLTCIADLIESRYGGRIRKHYLTELRVAAREA